MGLWQNGFYVSFSGMFGGRRGSASSDEDHSFHLGAERRGSEDGFQRRARSIYRALNKDVDQTVRQHFETNEDDQDELIERILNAMENDPMDTAASPDEEHFVESLRTAIDTENLLNADEEPSTSRIDAFVEYLVKRMNQQWFTLLYALFPFHQVQTLVLICLVQFVGMSSLLSLAPVVIAYAAFFFMAYFTMKMFRNESLRRKRSTWKRVVETFYNSQSDDKPSAKKICFQTDDNWEPYLQFFAALTVFLLAVGAADRGIPYCSVISAVSALFALTSFVHLSESSDRYASAAMLANLCSCVPFMLDRMRFKAAAFLWLPLMEIRLSYFTLNLSLASVCLLFIPIMYAVIAMSRKSWTSVANIIIPQLIFITWSDVAVTTFIIGWRYFGFVDVILCVSSLSLFFFPSQAAMTVVVGVLFAHLRSSLHFISLIKASITLLILVSPFLAIKLFNKLAKLYHLQVTGVTAAKRRWMLVIFYMTALVMAIAFLYEGQITFDPEADVIKMSWKDYEKQCSLTAANSIRQQEKCSQLKGTAIEWKGTVQAIRIVNIDNPFESLLGYLPENLAQSVRCFYDSNSTDTAKVNGVSFNECSLSEHHVYTFEIDVAGPFGGGLASSSKGQVVLSASHLFHKQLRLIDEGDVVGFIAFFEHYPVFRYPPKLKLLQLECITCKEFQKGRNAAHRVTSSKMNRSGLWRSIFHSFRFGFNFIFAPLIIIK